jgi:16S rRNA pseudouridine516 synthase
VGERLDAYLAHRGHGSRSEVKSLIRRGAVSVDGAVCRDPGRHIDPGGTAVEVGGGAVPVGVQAATLVFHKPVGYACSHDPREAPLIEALYPAEYQHLALESAGRLDRMTSGLLVVTTEGDLIHRLTNPRKKLSKRYRVAYTGRLSSHAVERCARGLDLDGDPRPTLPAKLVLLDAGDDGLERALLTLHEGRFHQVRRMIQALGGEVVRLHRDRIGDLDLPDDLAPGGIRPLTPRERALLTTEDARPGSEAPAEDAVEDLVVPDVPWEQLSLGMQIRLGRRPR